MSQTVSHGDDARREDVLTEAKTKRKSVLREYAEAIVIAVVLALFIRTFVVQAFKIPSGSMKPTLLVGDHILVSKFIYGIKIPLTDKTIIKLGTPKRGDVVVFKYPLDTRKDYIKRVIGLPGDRVELVNKKLFINGRVTDDPHASYSVYGNLRNFGPVTVPANHLFVMGDNRDESSDSRVWGFVPLPYLKGKAFLIYWSWDSKDFGVRWSRLGDLVR
ncbi:MAG: signal peptidase I [Deltaproteobacteria bacterium]|jgi:signal peptidase I|nr:signal peptidase I [Deltaproteobacteria bacterium]